MGSTERRARAKVALRQQILDAARDLFVVQGYDAVSMRKIADRIEYSPTAIYLHFEDKQALFQALCDETFLKLSRRLEALRKRQRDPIARLREGLRVYIDFGVKHPHHYTVAFMMRPRADAPPFECAAGAQAFSHLRDGVAEAMAAGWLKSGDVDATSQALWAACHGVVALLITVDPRVFPLVTKEALATRIIDTMIDGLKP